MEPNNPTTISKSSPIITRKRLNKMQTEIINDNNNNNTIDNNDSNYNKKQPARLKRLKKESELEQNNDSSSNSSGLDITPPSTPLIELQQLIDTVSSPTTSITSTTYTTKLTPIISRRGSNIKIEVKDEKQLPTETSRVTTTTTTTSSVNTKSPTQFTPITTRKRSNIKIEVKDEQQEIKQEIQENQLGVKQEVQTDVVKKKRGRPPKSIQQQEYQLIDEEDGVKEIKKQVKKEIKQEVTQSKKEFKQEVHLIEEEDEIKEIKKEIQIIEEEEEIKEFNHKPTTTSTTTTTTISSPIVNKKNLTKDSLENLGSIISDYEWDKLLNKILGIGIGDIPQQSKRKLKINSDNSFIKAIQLSRDYLLKYEIPFKCKLTSFIKSGSLVDNQAFIQDVLEFLERKNDLNISFSSDISRSDSISIDDDSLEDQLNSSQKINSTPTSTPTFKRESTAILINDDEEDEEAFLNQSTFMEQVLKESQPSDLRSKGLSSSIKSNGQVNHNVLLNDGFKIGGNDDSYEDDSEENLNKYEGQTLDILDDSRIINFRTKPNQTFTDNFDEIIEIGKDKKSIEWFKDIENRVLKNDGISKDSDEWLLFLRILEQCPLAIQGKDLVNGERLFFELDKKEKHLPSSDSKTFVAYSINTKKKVGLLTLNNLTTTFTFNIKAIMRKGFLKLAGTTVLTAYKGGSLQGYSNVEFYLSHKAQIIRGDHTRPDLASESSVEFNNGQLSMLLDILLNGPVSIGSTDTQKREQVNQEITNRDGFVKKNLLELPTPLSFRSELKQHQREGLWWMYSRELKPSVTYNESVYESWRVYKTFQGIEFYYNSVCDKISLIGPTSKHKISGGLLCDEMGLGKTVMSIALIMQNHPVFNPVRQHRETYQDIREELENRNVMLKKGTRIVNKPKATLIICPTSLCAQWKNEFKKHLKPEHYEKLNILDYWGPTRKKKLIGLDLNLVDIVITTHGSFGLDWKKYEEKVRRSNSLSKVPPLWSIHWWRVVVDESQVCKAKTLIFKGLQNIDSIHRWCLSGTPVQNYLDEMFPMLNFLNVFPIAENIRTWRLLVEKPKNIALLKKVLNPILLRRVKSEVSEIKLPKKHSEIITLEFDQYEKEDYSILFLQSEEILRRIQQRRGGILKNYACVLALLLRLRQCCDHFALIRDKGVSDQGDNCNSCFDIAVNPIYNSCHHLFCYDCMDNLIKNGDGKCGQCGKPLVIEENVLIEKQQQNEDNNDLALANKGERKTAITTTATFNNNQYLDMGFEEEENERDFQHQINQKFDEIIHQRIKQNEKRRLNKKEKLYSTKIKKLIQDIRDDIMVNEDEKCIVFSQWTSMLSIIEEVFIENDWKKNIHFVKFDGTLTPIQKDKVITSFNQEDGPRVMLMSIRAGGVGLNLTRANRAYLIDPWWNSAVELQAIGRLHRIGQTREVFIKRYIMDYSIEIRILELQKSKDEISNALFNDEYDPEKPFKNFKLNVDDIKFLFKGFPNH